MIASPAAEPGADSSNGKASRRRAGGLGAPFLPRARTGSAEAAFDVFPGEAWATSVRRSSTGPRPTGTSRSVAASRASDAAAAARKRSRNDSGSAGRSTWTGGRAPFVPRTLRGSGVDALIWPSSPWATSGKEDSPGVGGTAGAASADRSLSSGERPDDGTRLPSPMRKPPWRRERDAVNCRTAEHTSSYISRRITICHELTTKQLRRVTSRGWPGVAGPHRRTEGGKTAKSAPTMRLARYFAYAGSWCLGCRARR